LLRLYAPRYAKTNHEIVAKSILYVCHFASIVALSLGVVLVASALRGASVALVVKVVLPSLRPDCACLDR
jgi:hypothetical protein